MSYNAGQELSSLNFDNIIGGALNAVIKAQSQSALTTVNFVKSVGFQKDANGNITNPIYVAFKYPKEVAPYVPGRPAYTRLKIVKAGSKYSEKNIKSIKIGNEEVQVGLTLSNDGKIVDAKFKNEVSGKQGTLVIDAGPDVEAAEIVCEEVAATAPQTAIYQDMTLNVPVLTMLPIPFIRVASTDIEFNVKINSVSNTSTEESSEKKAGVEVSAGWRGWGAHVDCKISASMANQKKSSSTEEVKKEFSLNIKIHAVQDEIPVGLSRILDILEETMIPHVAA